MIIDTSAIVAILRVEPEYDAFLTIIDAAPTCEISAGSWVELGAVLSRRDDRLLATARQLIGALGISIAPVTAEQAELGQRAYLQFGKGRHDANLNFGDCFSYALAKATGRPLLFKGNDFTQTDIVAAI